MAHFIPKGLRLSILQRSVAGNSQTGRMFSRPAQAPMVFPLGIIPFLCGAFIILMLSVRDNKTVHHLNTALINLTVPLVDVVSQPFTALTSGSEFFRTHKSMQAEISALRKEKENHLSLIQTLQQKVLDHDQLKQLTHALPDARMERVSARVVGRISDGVNAMLTIKATEKLLKDQPVITADGVVGRVSEVGGLTASTARVMPLTDLSSRIPVEIESSHEHGVIAGHSSSELRLIHLEKRVKVKVGDRLVTSGYGGIFPRGLPVAIVTQVEGDCIKASPLVRATPSFVTILLSL